MQPISPALQIPPISPAPSSSPKLKLSQLTESLISTTGSVPTDEEIRECSALPLDLEKLKTIIDLVIQDKEFFSFLIYPHASKALSDAHGLANFGVRCEEVPENGRVFYLMYYGRQDGRPVLLKEILISVCHLISYKVQKDNNCLAGENLYSMNLTGIDIHHGNFCKTNLRKANLSYSTLCYVNLIKADLRGCNFEKAIMDKVRIEDAQIDEDTNFTNTRITLSFPDQLTFSTLFQILPTIDKINDDYTALKIELVHQTIDQLISEIFADGCYVFSNLIYFLKNPLYLQDKKITLFIAELFFRLNASSQSLTSVELCRFLSMVNKFGADHKVLKIKLVCQIIDLLNSETNLRFSDVQKVFSNLIHLSKMPIYLEEEKIISFIAERFFKLSASPGQLTLSRLYRLLAKIHTIHPAYEALKIKLVHQIIDSLKNETHKIFPNGGKVFLKFIQLLKDPIYLQDKKITSFIAEKFLNLDGSIVEPEDLLFLLAVIRDAHPETQQEIIRKSTGFVILLMTLCSELCEEARNQIGIPMLHQLIDCLNDADVSDSDNELMTVLLSHPAYINDRKIMLFMTSQLLKEENSPQPGLDSLFFRKIVECLSQEKFTSDSAFLIQLRDLYIRCL